MVEHYDTVSLARSLILCRPASEARLSEAAELCITTYPTAFNLAHSCELDDLVDGIEVWVEREVLKHLLDLRLLGFRHLQYQSVERKHLGQWLDTRGKSTSGAHVCGRTMRFKLNIFVFTLRRYAL